MVQVKGSGLRVLTHCMVCINIRVIVEIFVGLESLQYLAPIWKMEYENRNAGKKTRHDVLEMDYVGHRHANTHGALYCFLEVIYRHAVLRVQGLGFLERQTEKNMHMRWKLGFHG